ncbi:hypothetical protein Goklo_028877 [Gossypium klotzschianum]|uniref:Man1/Src1-like C-terminal domain-containing protein n=1 Tax=Gossypium klotzschianum TaxID=34286 RepID=A0A7J8U2Q2_9ROSI|nr:hypothetical protein [Gossypium klotzschianum]
MCIATDSCEPCPSNGECYEGNLECIYGYRRHGKLCIEDRDIDETAKKLSESVEAGLCEAYAQVLCYGTGTVWVRENDIWNDLDRHNLMQNVGSDHTTYVYMKRRAMETIAKLLETRTNLHGLQEFKCPDALAEHYKPLTCRFRELVSKHSLIIMSICAGLIGCAVLFLKVRQRMYISARAEELYNQVCDMLEENALKSKNVDGEGESWVVASWLRDHLLLPRERKDPQLWKKVEELVQDDSRVDRYPKLVKGESKVVWEWQVEGSLSSSGRRKKGEGIELKSNEGINTNINQSSRTLKTGALLAHIVHYASCSLFNLVSYLSNVVKVPWRPFY